MKCRYFVCQLDLTGADAVTACADTGTSDLFAALRGSVRENFGDAGWGLCAGLLAVKYYSPATRLLVVRCPTSFGSEAHASLALVRVVRGRPAALRVLAVASTQRSLRLALVHWSRQVGEALRRSVAPGDTDDGGGGGGDGGDAGPLLSEAFFAALEKEAASF